jgi:hypothetical protein
MRQRTSKTRSQAFEQDEYPPPVAQDRFGRAVDIAVVTKPMHRTAKPERQKKHKPA